MRREDFDFLARLARRRAGLSLPPDRGALVAQQLQPVMRRFDFRDVGAMVADLRLGHPALAEAAVEALTVGETSFFRDAALFARLEGKVLPRLLAARIATRHLRIWSAGCATGQEAWSLAMLVDRMGLAARGWLVDIIATDLSADAVMRAAEGRYSDFEVARGLSPEDLSTWFEADAPGFHRIAPRLRAMVSFRRFNLLDSFGWLDDLDIVLCRNVLIYFDPATRQSVVERIAETLAPDGVLALGEAECPPAGFASLPGGGLYAKTPRSVML